MKAADINTSLIEGYLRLLENLSAAAKFDLIAKLTASVKSGKKDKTKAFYNSFGAWESKKSAEEMIAEIRNSRNFNRQIEAL